jgi:hypothetical protein
MYKSTDKDILNNDDFVQEGAIEDHILVEIDKFIAVLPVLESAVKKSAASISNDLKNINLGGMKVADMQKLNKTLDDADKVMQNKLKTEKMHTQVLREQEKLEKDKLARQKAQLDLDKQQTKQNTDLESSYKKLNTLRKDQVKIYQDLAAKQAMGIRLTEEEGKQMEKSKIAAQAFDEKLKNIDYTIGNAQRNVGNYHNQLNTLGKSLKGFSALGNILARALGLDTEVFDSIKEGGKALQDIKHVVEGVTLAKEGETVAHEANTVAVEAETVATGLSTGGITLLTTAVIAVGAATVAYILHLEEEHEIQEALNKSNEKRVELLQEAAQLQRDNAKKDYELKVDQAVIDGKISKAEGDKLKASGDDFEKRQILRRKELQELKDLAAQLDLVFFKGDSIATSGVVGSSGQKDAIEAFYKGKQNIIAGYQAIEEAMTKDHALNVAKINQDARVEEAKEFDKFYKQLEDEMVSNGEYEYKKWLDAYKKREEIYRLTTRDPFANDKERGIKLNPANQKKIDQIHYDYLGWLDDNDRFNEALKKVKEQEDAITDAMREGLEKRAQMQQEYDQQGIDFHKRMYETQAKLAAEGKENTLAYEQAALTKAEEKRIQDQKRALKAQEGIALFKVFNDTLIKSLEKDPNSTFGERLQKALGETAVVKSIFSLLFSGSYEKGTESLDAKGNIDGRGGMAIIAHPKERIMTADQNEPLDGMSNDEVSYKASMFDSLYSQLYNSANASTTQSANASYNHDYRMTSTLSKEIRQMKQDITRAIEDKPVQFVNVGQVGQLIEKVVQGGITRTTNHFLKTRRPRV